MRTVGEVLGRRRTGPRLGRTAGAAFGTAHIRPSWSGAATRRRVGRRSRTRAGAGAEDRFFRFPLAALRGDDVSPSVEVLGAIGPHELGHRTVAGVQERPSK